MCLFCERGGGGNSCFGCLLAARSQHTVYADGDDVLKSAAQIIGHVERAMKCDTQRARQLDEGGRSFCVNSAVWFKDAEYHALNAGLFGGEDFLLHDLEFGVAVKKVSGARSNQDVKRNGDAATNGGYQRCGGREAAQCEARAKFDAVRPS